MTPLEIFKIVASMLAGLALFLTGMNTLSESLTKLTGGALNRVIGSITKNKYFAFIFGAGLTAVVQSSSAVTVLSVGLVNSGLIELGRAIGLIIGANLGTTATAWVLSLNAIDGESFLLTIIKPASFSPFLAAAGVVMTMFSHSEKKKNVGSVLLGFAVMMIGMNLMSSAVAPLRQLPAIQNTLVSLSNPILGFLFACLFAMIIQSSDAVIGIVQAFALSMGITFGTAIPLICGAQVGTCVTALLSSLGTSNNGKRTALLNLYYNLLKTIPIMLVFYILNSVFGFSFMSQNVGGIGIPLVHTLVNLLGSAVWLPLSGVIVSLASRTIPLSAKEKEAQANTLTMLDENLLVNPRFAMDQANLAVKLLSRTVGDAFSTVVGLMDDPDQTGTVNLLCDRAKQYHDQISAYLVKCSDHDMVREDRATLTLLISANSVFGKMGILTERILDKIMELDITPEMLEKSYATEVRILGESIREIIQLTITGFYTRNTMIPQTIRYFREELNDLTTIVKKRYLRYTQEHGRDETGSILFTDISYAQEQMVDYCDMIAEALVRYGEECGSGKKKSAASVEQTREQIHELFRDKFDSLSEG